MQQPKLSGKYEVSSSVLLDASQSEVWSVLEDFSNVSSWAPAVSESYAIGKGEKCVGAGRHCKLDGFGAIDEIITLWKEGTGFVYNVTPLGPLDTSHSCWWLTEITPGKCRLDVTLSYNIRFGLFGKMMHAMIMRKKLEESLPDTLQAVKTRVTELQSVAKLVSAAA